jgi:hypothetical protein
VILLTFITSHWQLRSLISSPEQNILYYPHGHEIIALNTKTRVREVISNLTFSPRCLTASKDWICCGGEGGKYSAIPLKDEPYGADPLTRDVDADARLPLDLDPARRFSTRDANTPRARSRPIPPNNCTIGSEIVNCITLWSPGDERSEEAYNIPVAVVSNNDRTVSILDLRDSDVLQKLTLPDFVNRSVISPDGSLLASICDDPFLYIHERRLKARVKKENLDSRTSQDYEWALSGRFQLRGQRSSDTSELRGSFAACFSRSGKYFATATQYGIISVFEVASLKENSYLPVVFTSSRPGPEPGAVRAMEFSNGPYDLLAWTESHGRLCVADVRNLFLSRQLVMLDPHADGLERVAVLDREAEHDPVVIDPRLRTSRHESRSSSSTPDLLAIEAERRQIRQLTRVILDRYDPPPFSAEETEVLHASQIARRQRDNVASRETNGETSASSRWSTWDEIPRSSMNSSSPYGETGSRDDRRISTTGLPPALREFINPDRTASFRTFINERNRENERRNLRQQEPRRRNSVMLAAAENALEREVARNESEAANSLERLTLRQPRILGSDSPNNPWADIDALYRSRYASDPPIDRTARLRVELEDEQNRDYARNLRQPFIRTAMAEGVTTIPLPRRDESPALRPGIPGATMGCCWSQDGRIL